MKPHTMDSLLLLLLVFIAPLIPCSCTSSLHGDANILASIKEGLHSYTPELAGWDASNLSSVCSWFGVRCEDDHVVGIDISNLKISGSISAEISGLDSLINLSLAGNQLHGEIRVSNLPRLRYLNISSNQFDGGLDWDYWSLPSLEVFDAYDNNFTAMLPLGVSSLKSIKYLDLGGNYFSGRIPASYGSLTTLEYLSLNGNDLRGRIPSELGKLTSLRQLYLGYYNEFDGGVPAELGNLINLVHLDISSCGLAGEIPHQMGYLINLDTLFLHTNQLSGRLPPSLGNLTRLAYLDLSNNALTGEVPRELAALTKLSLLNLFMNQLHGSVPEFIGELPNLDTLQLFMNNFTGIVPANLGASGQIRVLDISSNRLTGTMPANLCPFNKLKVLILLKNFLFGSIPESLGECLSLTRVRLGQNYLNGSIPTGFLYLPQLNLLELQTNYLSGPIPENPDTSRKPTQLVQLNLSNNLLSGPIPSSICNLSSLQTLLLRNNQLVGPIPDSIGSIHHLVKLDLSHNSLSGSIPPEIQNCTQLTYLDLSRNNLSGHIPSEIAGIGILNYLNLSHNQLNGSIPRSFAAMRSLTAADFSFNDLSGQLSDFGQLAYMNATSFSGNPKLCGPSVISPCNYVVGPVQSWHVHGNFKLIFVLGLLLCSFLFALAAAVRARSCRSRSDSATWRLTTFHKVDFTVSDVLDCMKDTNVVGRGGAGVVYLGRTRAGSPIAVKRLMSQLGSTNHDHGFGAEIRTLGSIRHRNIVRLLAFCSDSATNVLVYEYMANGSLGELLHGKGGEFLGWSHRYRIAVEAARGLCYLHHDCSPMIVHRDVKSNNILLDTKFEAHVADFGLAKFLQDGGGSQNMSAIAGSYGYIAPEYAYTLKVDEKSDVYSFGVVLLELVTGRRPVGEFGDGVNIVQWAKRTTDGRRENAASVVDTRMGSVPMNEVMHVFFVAMSCVREKSVERPTMREVVQMLSEFPHHVAEY
ncbi:leucine-rich repeat receptor-like serine/threonine-protein kinase BAM1 [Canna indica]|uniref:non-specific serine/threonine protein kinase n=1 Tax=Canna indica TaxID=4628 RepID=A0AAQ3K3G5_9LILI|nr:leucine-rich repeat receptor-like serine/threonine-protein kinase BAM1 [Canna indica]